MQLIRVDKTKKGMQLIRVDKTIEYNQEKLRKP